MKFSNIYTVSKDKTVKGVKALGTGTLAVTDAVELGVAKTARVTVAGTTATGRAFKTHTEHMRNRQTARKAWLDAKKAERAAKKAAEKAVKDAEVEAEVKAIMVEAERPAKEAAEKAATKKANKPVKAEEPKVEDTEDTEGPEVATA